MARSPSPDSRRTPDEISRVTQLVSGLPGVNEVKNEMTVTENNAN